MAELPELLTESLRDLAAEAPGLPPLSPRARKRIRAGRFRAILASVVVVAGACAGLVIGAQALIQAARSQPPSLPISHPGWAASKLGGVDALAASGSTLYVTAGDYPHATLSAFERLSGKLIHRIGVPGGPGALRVGPGGSVWLTFGPEPTGGSTGLWLLSPDLRQRSSLNPRAAESMDLSDLLPTGTADAVVAARGFADLHMPVPGQHGGATLHQLSAFPADHGFRSPVVTQVITRLAGRFAALQGSNNGRSRIVLAGRQGPVFESGSGVRIDSIASGGNGLWVTTGPQTSPQGLIRLNDLLQVVTPRSIRSNPALDFPEQVWATGDTVVVSTDVGSRPLACFRFQNRQAGPVTEIPARLPPEQVAVTRDTVYAGDTSGVIAYRLPAACL